MAQAILSERKLQILALHLEGKTNNEIAEIMKATPSSIRFHISAIKKGDQDKRKNPFDRIKAIEARIDRLEKEVLGYFEQRRKALERKMK